MQPLRYSQSALKRLWQDECGIATVYFVTVLPVLFAVVALGEFGLVQVSGARLQAVADAAAAALAVFPAAVVGEPLVFFVAVVSATTVQGLPWYSQAL